MFCLFLRCVVFNPPFLSFSTLSPAFHLQCPGLSEGLSFTSKGTVCAAADNTLYPKAVASFSRAPTRTLRSQVRPFLCLVANCFFFAAVSSFHVLALRLLYSLATGLGPVHTETKTNRIRYQKSILSTRNRLKKHVRPHEPARPAGDAV